MTRCLRRCAIPLLKMVAALGEGLRDAGRDLHSWALEQLEAIERAERE